MCLVSRLPRSVRVVVARLGWVSIDSMGFEVSALGERISFLGTWCWRLFIPRSPKGFVQMRLMPYRKRHQPAKRLLEPGGCGIRATARGGRRLSLARLTGLSSHTR